MNKSLIAGLLAVSVVSPVLAFAQSSSTPMEERKAQREERREERVAQMETRRAEIESRMEERRTAMEARRAELKTKLAEWKDQKRAEVAQRISDNLDKVNARLVEVATKHIEKLEDVLKRVDEGDVDGDGDADIDAAEEAIDDAQDAVETQAAKTYALGSVDETTVGALVSAARKQLRTDLGVMMQAVKDAREAVRKAATHIDAREADENDDNASSTN